MRHLHSGRKLGRSPDHRRATLRALTLAIIENEAIQTIPSRAKELRWYAERAVTLAKRGDVASVRLLVKMLGSTEDAEKTTPKDKVEKKNTKDIKKKSAAPIEDQPVAKTAKKDKVAVKPAEDKKSKPAKKD